MSATPHSQACFIAGDWGTSRGRFMLCDEQGRVLDRRESPGAAESRGRFAAVFDAVTADWRRDAAALPAVLSGMVGSAFGWREMPYLPCPADLGELVEHVASARADVTLVPGMRCTNPLGAPDFMRGEETQLLGALRLQPALASGRHLLCLPGTHTKWAALFDGELQEFLTAPTGELFALLRDHSVLVRDPTTAVEHRPEDFERGLAEARRHGGALLHQLFQARSLRLDAQLEPAGAASWLSGLLIGADVQGGLAQFSQARESSVCVIGAAHLAECYVAALQRCGRQAWICEGDQAALAGLTQIFHARQGLRA